MAVSAGWCFVWDSFPLSSSVRLCARSSNGISREHFSYLHLLFTCLFLSFTCFLLAFYLLLLAFFGKLLSTAVPLQRRQRKRKQNTSAAETSVLTKPKKQQAMKIKAIIDYVNERKSGVSPVSGHSWVAQDIIIRLIDTGNPDHVERLSVTMTGDSIAQFDSSRLGVGSQFVGELHFYTSKTRNGYVNTRIYLSAIQSQFNFNQN